MPPAVIRGLLRALAPADVRESLLADLDEGFERQLRDRGARRARRWYRRQAIRGAMPLMRMRWRQRHVPSPTQERSMTPFEALTRDLRYAVRLLWKSPAFTLPAILTLALGLGATTAIFSVVHAALLTPLPYPSPGGIVMVWQDMRARGGPAQEWATPGNLVDWSAETRLFNSVASIRQLGATLTGTGEPEMLPGEQVTRAYFDVLGVPPMMGRGFRVEETLPNAPRVVILSHGAWQRRFGGDANVLGRRIMLNGEPHEIVGVMPADFRPVIVSNAEVWRPERFNLVTPLRGAVVLRVVARLAPGVSIEQARAQASVLAGTLEARYPEFNKGVGFAVVPLQDQVVSDVRPGLIVLSGAVVFVLLIASVNVANLLLARASSRTRELGVRMALGASRARIARQLLTESLLLAMVGGLLGIFVSWIGIKALVALGPAGLPRLNEVGLNGGILLFAAAMTTVTGLLFGLVPALQGSRNHGPTVAPSSRGAVGGPGRRTRRMLIIGEVAVALVLLVGGGLLLRTFVALQRSDLGFDPTDVTVGFVFPPGARYPNEASRSAFYDQVLERAQALPGVQTAALSSVIPLSGNDSDMGFQIEGAPPPRTPDEAAGTWYRIVSAGYFDALGIPFVRGRAFAAREPAPEVVINEAVAKKHWPGQEPVGRRVRFDPNGPWFTVTGIVGDVKHQGPRGEARSQMFLPFWHFSEGAVWLVLKAPGGADRLVKPLKDAVAQVDNDVPVARIAPLAQLISMSIERPRFLALLVVLFAGLAAVLSAVGILGVMSYLVAQRTSEMAVRLALGASAGQVLWLVLGDGVRLAAIGVAIGVAASLSLTPALGTLLFGVSPFDPVTFLLMSAALLAVAALATAIPARRAMRVSPVVALKDS